jgi:hypothetical protein
MKSIAAAAEHVACSLKLQQRRLLLLCVAGCSPDDLQQAAVRVVCRQHTRTAAHKPLLLARTSAIETAANPSMPKAQLMQNVLSLSNACGHKPSATACVSY